MSARQRKIKRYFLIFLPILTLLTGCEFKDIDKDVFVSMIGIDQSDDSKNPYKVTLKLYVPSSSYKQNPEPRFAYITENGKTLTEAIRMLESHTDKEIQFGHAKLIVIGEDLLKADKTQEIMDFLLRRPDIQMIAWIAIGRPSAEEVLQLISKGETAVYPSLFNYFDQIGTESPYIITTYLFDLRRRMVEHGIDPILPIVEVNKKESQFEINKSFVLANKRDPHELGSLNTLIYNTVSRNIGNIDIVVDEDDEYFIAKIDKIKSKYKVKVQKGNQITININLTLNGNISESKRHIPNKELPRINKLLETETKKNLTKFLTEMVNNKYDPLGIGLKYRAGTLHNHRMTKEQWEEAYKNAKFDVTIKPGIKSTGTIQ